MKEIRKLNMEFRTAENEDGELRIEGYAARVNKPETYSYTEVIAPGAFNESDMSDVVLRYNHNDSFMVLARTRNKSLDLKVDENGLYIDAVLQKDITDHVNIYNAIKSGLIDKQSFAFVVDEDEYDYDTDTRTIKKIGKIFDVSVVDQPFYNSTDVVAVKGADNDDFLEKRDELRKQHEEELKQKEFEEKKKALLEKLG